MTKYLFPPAATPSVAIDHTTHRFAVRRIICVGRNYAAHAAEMGFDASREPPFFFFKPADAVIDSGNVVPYPPLTESLHYEIELVAAIGVAGSNIGVDDALDHVWGYGVGIDLTRRDLQIAARDKGRPWDWGKSFDQSAPCSPLRAVAEVGHPARGRIWLSVNGNTKQDADLAELIWSVPEIVAGISQAMRLEVGDLIYTGTPSGVGPVVRGDAIRGGVEGVGEIEISID